MKVRFKVRFSTKYGQRLWVSGNSPELGNCEHDLALPMHYLDHEFWHLDLKIKKSEKIDELNYKYFLTNENGEVIDEGGSDRAIDLKKHHGEEIEVVDIWNHAGEYENAFYTAPFTEVLLKNEKPKYKKDNDKSSTHILKVKAPLLAKDEVVCVLGSGKRLNEWDEQKPVLLERKSNWWTVKLDLSNEHGIIFYKYCVYNVSENKLVQYEDGDNRLLNTNSGKDFTILHDGFIRLPNNTWKGTGIAIPVFSLRSHRSFGTGEFSDLKILVDWSGRIGLKLIQLLPVNDTISSFSWMDSYPYSAISAFALHPLYINLEQVASDEHSALLDEYVRKKIKLNEKEVLDYEVVLSTKLEILSKLYELLGDDCLTGKGFKHYYKQNKHWLNAYAAFCYFRDTYKTADFNTWETNAVYRAESIEELCERKSTFFKEIGFYFFTQYHLHLQLKEAVEYAHENGIVIKGDIPIGISPKSCDAWMAPHLYNMQWQAGAPPDDFTAAGQNWGFPTYNWKVMQSDGFAWWKQRFEQMAHYFDAFRIDHILGFFRIWSIPIDHVQGIMGRFVPAIPVHMNEFNENGLWFDYDRFCKPFITDETLQEEFGELSEKMKTEYLTANDKGGYDLLPDFSTQRKVEKHFANKKKDDTNNKIKTGLYNLIANVILFEEANRNGQSFHFRIAIETTSSFRHLIPHVQERLRNLYDNYFYKRQDDFWEKEAMHKLPMLKAATNMLVCGEDLGMVPHCVPDVMAQLGILSLEIQRMPKNPATPFFIPSTAPYLSVITPSTHDMSTIREWWQEDASLTQAFYNQVLHKWGTAPIECETSIANDIVQQHLQSPAMWCIFQLQDLLSISAELRHKRPHAERINNPANPNHYWQYRMHLYLEDLENENRFNEQFKSYLLNAGR